MNRKGFCALSMKNSKQGPAFVAIAWQLTLIRGKWKAMSSIDLVLQDVPYVHKGA